MIFKKFFNRYNTRPYNENYKLVELNECTDRYNKIIKPGDIVDFVSSGEGLKTGTVYKIYNIVYIKNEKYPKNINILINTEYDRETIKYQDEVILISKENK